MEAVTTALRFTGSGVLAYLQRERRFNRPGEEHQCVAGDSSGQGKSINAWQPCWCWRDVWSHTMGQLGYRYSMTALAGVARTRC